MVFEGVTMILIEILKAVFMIFVMAEWVRVLADMIRERKGTRLVKSEESIKYADKKDNFLNATILCGTGINKRYKYIDVASMIGDV